MLSPFCIAMCCVWCACLTAASQIPSGLIKSELHKELLLSALPHDKAAALPCNLFEPVCFVKHQPVL